MWKNLYFCTWQRFVVFLWCYVTFYAVFNGQNFIFCKLRCFGAKSILSLFTRAGTLGYIANISRCHISDSLGKPGYIAIYRTHSAHFYELRMNYGEFCSISHFAVYCNALVNFFIVCDCYITFAMWSYHSFQHHLATFTLIQLWNWLVPSSWHCVLT